MHDDLADKIGPLEADGARRRSISRLQDVLRGAIESRHCCKPQEALPAERDLATEFAVSRITVRKALDGLVADGLLTRRQGAGTFVAGRVEKQFSKLTSFSEDMAARGRMPHSEWLTQDRRRGDAGRIADPGAEPRHAGLSLQPHPLRRRCADGARIFDDRRALACPGSMRSTRRSMRRSRPPGTGRCAPCSGCARCCSTRSRRVARDRAGRAGALHRTARVPRGWPRDRDDAQLVPRRRL